MKYTVSVGDIYETYEGTPEEIAELLMRKPESIELQEGIKSMGVDENELTNYINELTNYIYGQLFVYNMGADRELIEKILDLQLEFLKLKGIAE